MDFPLSYFHWGLGLRWWYLELWCLMSQTDFETRANKKKFTSNWLYKTLNVVYSISSGLSRLWNLGGPKIFFFHLKYFKFWFIIHFYTLLFMIMYDISHQIPPSFNFFSSKTNFGEIASIFFEKLGSLTVPI